MSPAADHEYMARALRLAERGLFTTDPNPRVGCVVVDNDGVAGEGWHARAGEPHAEIIALQQAGARARGAIAYVTLEPCCHQGRTPPCTDALIETGVRRVVVAMEDPNPLVAGKGVQALQQAGIEVTLGVLAAQATALNPGFIKRMQTGLPWVRCKLAMSLDGRTAMAGGESHWITGEAARRDVHRLRARSSAVLSGIMTVLADDPALTARPDGIDPRDVRQPLRVVLDSRLRIPAEARLLTQAGDTLVLTGNADTQRAAELNGEHVRVVVLPMSSARLNLKAVLQYLGEQAVNEVHVEAGATLCGALLQDGLIDELVFYMAPHLMGDAARGLFTLPGLEKMEQRVKLTISDIRAVGEDWRITARVASQVDNLSSRSDSEKNSREL